MTYPPGRIVTYVRNAQGQITGVTTKANATAAVVTLASNVKWQPNLAGFAGGADGVFGAGNAGTATQAQALPGEGGLGNVDLLQSLTYGNGLILWKNFSQDNELYQLIVENGATQIIDLYYNRADQTDITGIADALVTANVGHIHAITITTVLKPIGCFRWFRKRSCTMARNRSNLCCG